MRSRGRPTLESVYEAKTVSGNLVAGHSMRTGDEGGTGPAAGDSR
jgi:hypothetical protein